MSVLRQQRRVPLCLQRDRLNLRPLLEMYTSKSLLPHTLPNVHSQRHLQSYTFTEQSMRGELCFHGVFIWLMGRRKKQGGLLKHNMAPWWQEGAVHILCRGFPLWVCCPVLCSHSVHTQSGLQICSWFKEDHAHWKTAEADGFPY